LLCFTKPFGNPTNKPYLLKAGFMNDQFVFIPEQAMLYLDGHLLATGEATLSDDGSGLFRTKNGVLPLIVPHKTATLKEKENGPERQLCELRKCPCELTPSPHYHFRLIE
jgi:hypothetical protein